MAKKTYTVLRPHQGDRFYEQGETREAEPADVAHLVPGTLVLAKAQPTPKNKAAQPAKNKGH